ncbi:aldehyde-activating protein [Sphingomonas metalli]|uniref:Aldehyde-activating protein n=1 Tax=Sphingomonas metalli TaxID=1779358 RepID=A0A916ST99_9SPHN|nr:GFA family protein [Sphingomonas metalli]GGB16572.1 aldehyde-activating protein [Sphingomonas metalli]
MTVSADAPVTGGCLCGAVRYTLSAEPVAARRCWCRLCQYLAAGTATANLIVPREALAINGPLASYASTADSGAAMHRTFCPTCGTPVGGYAEPRPHLYVLRIGTLDDPDRFPPQITIWTSAAPHWALIDPNQPAIATQPAPPAPAMPAR